MFWLGVGSRGRSWIFFLEESGVGVGVGFLFCRSRELESELDFFSVGVGSQSRIQTFFAVGVWSRNHNRSKN